MLRRSSGAPRRRGHHLGYRVRQPTGTDVVDRDDRIALAERPAAVDDLLGAPLDLGVTALDGSEIELRARAAAPERGGGAAPQADQHRRAAEHDELRAGRHRGLVDMHAPDASQSPGEHDRLVVAADEPATVAGS